MPKIIVTSGNAEIKHNHAAMIGGKEDWVISSPSGTLSNIRLQFSAMNAVIGGYTQTEEKTTVTPFALNNDKAKFYWVTTGQVTVTISGTVAGEAARLAIEVKVHTPNVIEYVGTASKSEIRSMVPPGREAHAADETFSWLAFGNSAVKSGISFHAKVGMPQIPGSNGKLSMLQVMKVYRKKTKVNHGGEDLATSNGEVVLDQEVHYGFEHDGESHETLDTTPVSSYTLTTEDSPATTMGKSGVNQEYERVEVCEEYRMYLMFRPTKGIWVAIGDIDWKWHATATFNALGNKWALAIGGGSTEDRYIQKNQLVSCRLPEWSQSSGDLLESDH